MVVYIVIYVKEAIQPSHTGKDPRIGDERFCKKLIVSSEARKTIITREWSKIIK